MLIKFAKFNFLMSCILKVPDLQFEKTWVEYKYNKSLEMLNKLRF